METHALRFVPALFVGSLLLLTGCSSAPPPVDNPNAVAEDWIDNPGNIRNVLAVVGSAPILGNVSAARMRAEANGRGQMAATLQAQVQSMMTNWFKETGDMLNASSVTSLMNDEGLTRQIANVEISGARPVKYKTRDNVQYVLLALEDPSTFVQNAGKSVKDRALKDETLLKTEGMKNAFQAKMDQLIKADSKTVGDSTKDFLTRYAGEQGAPK